MAQTKRKCYPHPGRPRASTDAATDRANVTIGTLTDRADVTIGTLTGRADVTIGTLTDRADVVTFVTTNMVMQPLISGTADSQI